MVDHGAPMNDILVQEDLPEVERYFGAILGALVGAAVADALGWVTEFRHSRQELMRRLDIERITDFISWDKATGGRFNTHFDYIAPGEYSDDTQLTLAVARSIRADGTCDHQHFAKVELTHWLTYSRGAGQTISEAARKIARKSASWNRNFFKSPKVDYRQAGANGVAMRVSPIALANLRDRERCWREILKNAVVTHGHPRALLGAALLGEALRTMTSEPNASTKSAWASFYDLALGRPPWTVDELGPWVKEWNQGGDFESAWTRTVDEMRILQRLTQESNLSVRETLAAIGCFDPATKGSGTGCAVAALFLFERFEGRYEPAILEAVNSIPGDTDTIGALTGSLCGARVRYEGLPERLTFRLQDRPYFEVIAERLARVSMRVDNLSNSELLPDAGKAAGTAVDLMTAAEERSLESGSRVYHPLFGNGYVDGLFTQRSGKGGFISFVRVRFDIGQSCQFKIRQQRVPASLGTRQSDMGIPERQHGGKIALGRIRTDLALTRYALADAISVPLETVVQWEAGLPIPADMLKRIDILDNIRMEILQRVGRKYAGQWLNLPNPVLNGEKPLALLRRGSHEKLRAALTSTLKEA